MIILRFHFFYLQISTVSQFFILHWRFPFPKFIKSYLVCKQTIFFWHKRKQNLQISNRKTAKKQRNRNLPTQRKKPCKIIEIEGKNQSLKMKTKQTKNTHASETEKVKKEVEYEQKQNARWMTLTHSFQI